MKRFDIQTSQMCRNLVGLGGSTDDYVLGSALNVWD
jgi:hypothetical protein